MHTQVRRGKVVGFIPDPSGYTTKLTKQRNRVLNGGY
jgi:hypothetical protein